MPGDLVSFARGPRGAHQLVNRQNGPARILIVSTRLHPEFAEFPDSGKILVIGGASPEPGTEAPLELPFRKDSSVDYWEGEGGAADDRGSPGR